MLPYLEALNARFGIPIIYVTHDADEVLRLASDVVLLAEGKVAASGGLGEVTSRLDLPPEAEALGLGAVLDGRVEAHDDARGLSSIATTVGLFKLPLLKRDVGARVAVRVAARDVSIALERPSADAVARLKLSPGANVVALVKSVALAR